jgi:hypothetical protein
LILNSHHNELNLHKAITAEQREISKYRNELLISRQAAEQDAEIPILEPNCYSYYNPELKRVEAIKQRELVLENASADREAELAELEAIHYRKAAKTAHLNEKIMWNAAKAR